MESKKQPLIQPNELIHIIEKYGDDIRFIQGYPGSTEDGKLKVYPIMSNRSYYEIPEMSIIHTEPSIPAEKNSSVLFLFLKDTKLKLITNFNLNEPRFQFSTLFPIEESIRSFDLPNISVGRPNASCLKKCLESIKSNLKYFTYSNLEWKLNNKGKRAVQKCLVRCGYPIVFAQLYYAQLESRFNLESDPEPINVKPLA